MDNRIRKYSCSFDRFCPKKEPFRVIVSSCQRNSDDSLDRFSLEDVPAPEIGRPPQNKGHPPRSRVPWPRKDGNLYYDIVTGERKVRKVKSKQPKPLGGVLNLTKHGEKPSGLPYDATKQESERELGSAHQRDQDSIEARLSSEYLGTASFSELQTIAETVGDDRFEHNTSQQQSPSPTELQTFQQFEKDSLSSATSSSSEFELWNAEVPFGSCRRMLQGLEALKPGNSFADDYIIEAGNIDGKTHLRIAKHKYRKQEVVILKFYWREEQFENTLDVHQRLSESEHVCRIVQSLKTPRTNFPPCVAFERGTQTLAEWIKGSRPQVDRVWCLHQILTAVKDLHAIGVVHCDLKPSNVMFFADGVRWKLIDFDGARKAGSERANSFTAVYAAPEAVLEYMESAQLPLAQPSLDLWSIGVIAYEILTGKRFFGEDVALETTYEFIEGGKVEENLAQMKEEPQRDVVSSFLMMESHKRKSAAEMLQHSLFRSTSCTTTTT